MEQTVSNLRKEYIEAVYCHPAYSTYMQNTSCCMKHKLESRLQGEISITDTQIIHRYIDTQVIPPLWQKRRGSEEPLGETER